MVLLRMEEKPPPLVLVEPEKTNFVFLKENPPLERPPMTLSLTVIHLSPGFSSVKSKTTSPSPLLLSLFFFFAPCDSGTIKSGHRRKKKPVNALVKSLDFILQILLGKFDQSSSGKCHVNLRSIAFRTPSFLKKGVFC